MSLELCDVYFEVDLILMPTVLIVHASVDDRAMYADYLRAHAYDVVECERTDEALTQASEADVTITGLMVPGSFDGVELIRRLRGADATRNRPVIVLTACVTKEHEEAARQAGCDAFLGKPCLPDVLLAKVREVLSVKSF